MTGNRATLIMLAFTLGKMNIPRLRGYNRQMSIGLDLAPAVMVLTMFQSHSS